MYKDQYCLLAVYGFASSHAKSENFYEAFMLLNCQYGADRDYWAALHFLKPLSQSFLV